MVLTSALLAHPPAAGATFPGVNGRIAFTRESEARGSVDTIGLDGSRLVRLATGGGATWSPDGSMLAFEAGSIYVVRADGSGRRRIARAQASDSVVTWAPNGSKLAFTTLHGGNLDVDVVDVVGVDGSRRHTVARIPLPASDPAPAWSPDGSRIAFTRTGPDGRDDVYVVDADGSHQRDLTSDPANDTAPAWSPDGSRIAFTSDRGSSSGQPGVFVMNADGTGVSRLADGSDPVWSPDGSKIAFVVSSPGDPADRVPPGPGQIGVVDADGRGVETLTGANGKDAEEPRWSPDGTKLVFQYGAELYVMDADGSHRTRLTSKPPVDDTDPDWQPLPIAALALSPPALRTDGAVVSFTAGRAWWTRFTVQRALAGVRRGRACVAPTRAGRGGRRCTRYRSLGSFRRRATIGRDSFRFAGRIRGAALAPGRYRLVAVARAGRLAGPPLSRAFRILAP